MKRKPLEVYKRKPLEVYITDVLLVAEELDNRRHAAQGKGPLALELRLAMNGIVSHVNALRLRGGK